MATIVAQRTESNGDLVVTVQTLTEVTLKAADTKIASGKNKGKRKPTAELGALISEKLKKAKS